MTGMVWQWGNQDTLVLTAETPGRPAGATYLGARIQFLTSVATPPSPATKATIPRRRVSITPPQLPTELASKVPPAGTWQLTFPRGAKRSATLKQLAGGTYEISGGGVLNGTYRWSDQKLAIEAPRDERIIGLTWQWTDATILMLIAEPTPPPTGSSYLGTLLRTEKPLAESPLAESPDH